MQGQVYGHCAGYKRNNLAQETTGGTFYGFRSKQSFEKFYHVLELFMTIVDIWMRVLVGHNLW